MTLKPQTLKSLDMLFIGGIMALTKSELVVCSYTKNFKKFLANPYFGGSKKWH